MLISCATPKPPTGGLGDKEGPQLLSQFPENGTINFDQLELEFVFNEFLTRNSVTQALNIEPDLGIQPIIKMGRKSFKVVFEESLPANTTVIVQCGTELKDSSGNALEKPITLAFSTGDQIDRGVLAGALYKAEDGKGEAGRKVYLFPESADPTQDAAKYTAETDTGGVFTFSYIAEGFYQALWIDDANRNRTLDVSREAHSTFRQETIYISSDSIAVLSPIYLTLDDTLKPTLFENGLLTSQRLNLQFSEPIKFDQTTSVFVEDSLGNKVDGNILYVPASNESSLLVHLSEPLGNEQMNYRVQIENIKDFSGNRANIRGEWFEGNAQQDTVLQRLVPFGIQEEYFYQDTLEFRYAKPFETNAAEVDSFFVNTPSEITKPWPKLEVIANRLRVIPDSLWLDESITFNLWDPTDLSHAAYNPEIWSPQELGSIDLIFDSNQNLVDSARYEIRIFDSNNSVYQKDGFRWTEEDTLDQIDQLPAKKLRLVVFEDLNNNGRYDLGSKSSNNLPERYFFLGNADIRSGFATEIQVDFLQADRLLVQKLSNYDLLIDLETDDQDDVPKLELNNE